MSVDWNVVATMASPLVALFVGAALNRAIESRPRVVSYLGHVSGIFLSRATPPMQVNTHSVVLRNTGRKTARNVRLGHAVLPDFSVYPDIEYSVADLPGGGKEIRFPQLVPEKQVTVSYLYFPPITWGSINTHVESDDGPVKVLNVLPTVQLPKWLSSILWFLIGYGVLGAIYSLYAFALWASV